jgi:protein PhnA
MENEFAKRSNGVCELCRSNEPLQIHVVTPKSGASIDHCIHICGKCAPEVKGELELTPNHWRCLNDSIWSEVDAVKVTAWRLLNALKSEGWPNDLLEMMYMDEEAEAWAKSGIASDDAIVHIDSNGVQLHAGDSIVLIKDLKVKGGNFTAKRGTAVRNIILVHDNAEQIEGKVEGQRIVILTQYVKK